MFFLISSYSLATGARCPNSTETTSSSNTTIRSLQISVSKVISKEQLPKSILKCESLSCFHILGKQYPIKLTSSLLKIEPKKRFKYMQEFFSELLKLPKIVLRTLKKKGYTFILTVLGDKLLTPKGKPVRGWNPKYPVVAFQSGKNSFIAIDSIYKGHASKNSVLHEAFHLFDQNIDNKLSLGVWYPGIHSREKWERSYYKKYPDEALAESFALYYDSEIQRNLLKRSNPQTFRYIEKLKLR
jgi:hypothetical protein